MLTENEERIIDEEYKKGVDWLKQIRARRYMSGQQAQDEGIISEDNWQQAIAHPWTWVIISDTLKIREIPWQGLEVSDMTSQSVTLNR